MLTGEAQPKENRMDTLRTTFLMTFLTVALIRTGRMLSAEEGAWAAFICALAAHGIAYWFGDKIVLRMYGAREIQPDRAPQLCRIVQELAFRAQMPMPRFYLLPERSPIAFATGRDERHAAVAVQQDMQALDEAKLRSVLARDLSQIKHRDRVVGIAIAIVIGAVSMFVNIVE
jgi:heat shock protein HtpX